MNMNLVAKERIYLKSYDSEKACGQLVRPTTWNLWSYRLKTLPHLWSVIHPLEESINLELGNNGLGSSPCDVMRRAMVKINFKVEFKYMSTDMHVTGFEFCHVVPPSHLFVLHHYLLTSCAGQHVCVIGPFGTIIHLSPLLLPLQSTTTKLSIAHINRKSTGGKSFFFFSSSICFLSWSWYSQPVQHHSLSRRCIR